MLKFRFTPQHLSHFMKPNFLKFHSLPYPHKHIRHFSMYLCVKIHMDQSSKIRVNWYITQTQVIKFSCEKLILIQNLSHFFECQNYAQVSFYPTTFIPFYEAKFPKVSFPPIPPQANSSLQYVPLCKNTHGSKFHSLPY